MFQLMAVEGVMARRVADVRAGLLAVAGPHVRDPLALLVPFEEAATDRPFRVAVCADPPGGTTDAGIVDAIRHAADALADAGCDVVDAVPESYERALDLWRNLINVDVREQLPLLEQVLGPDALTFIRYAEEVTPALSLAEFSAGLIERLAVEKVFHRFLFPAAGGFDVLLTPTRLYARPVKAVLRHYRVKQVVHGIAHITGGGLVENLARIVPAHVQIALDRGSWSVPPVFPWVQRLGRIADDEMERVFNMGVGLVLVVSPHFADSIQSQLAGLGFDAWRIGTARAAAAADERVVLA
jgi:hypothetical protein